MNIQLSDVELNKTNSSKLKDENIIHTINKIKNDKIKLSIANNNLNSDIQKIKQKYQNTIYKTETAIIKNTLIIENFCNKHRKTLTQNNKKKSITIHSLTARWRKKPAKIQIQNPDKVLQNCLKLNLLEFIRTKHEINKQTIKLKPEIANNIDGIKILPGKEIFTLDIK